MKLKIVRENINTSYLVLDVDTYIGRYAYDSGTIEEVSNVH